MGMTLIWFRLMPCAEWPADFRDAHFTERPAFMPKLAAE